MTLQRHSFILTGRWSVPSAFQRWSVGTIKLGTHIIMGEPRFVDAENGDFHLRSDSPAINVGDDSVIEIEIDLDGNPRVVGGWIDLGAYEVQ
jgi:hypothetical protein